MSLKFFFVIAACLQQPSLPAQEIVNFVLVGEKGITEEVKKAISFIVVKRYPGNIFERLDYSRGAPLFKLRTYSDSNLTVLHGAYLEYHPTGDLHVHGQYNNGKKEDDWHYYNDTSKHIRTETYREDSLIKSVVPEVKRKVKDSTASKDDRQAMYKGGMNSWVKYLQKNMDANVALKSVRGGSVRVMYIVDTLGLLQHIYLKRSVEFVLDEEAIRVIRKSPKWIPALQKGKPVKAYRIQPVTFIKQ